MKLFTRIWKDESGQDLIEYALMAGFVAVAAAGIFSGGIVDKLQEVFTAVEGVLTDSAS